MMKMNIRHIRNFLSNFCSQTNKRGNFITSQPLMQCNACIIDGVTIVFALYYHHIVFFNFCKWFAAAERRRRSFL